MKYAGLKIAGVALVAGLFTGCASSGQPVVERTTHEWVAGDRVTKVHFYDNNVACEQGATTVSAYENCMQGRGYELYTP
jgi:hypothetical protein